MSDKELYKIASAACLDVYGENIDLGTTEFSSRLVSYNNFVLQVLAIAGTNEVADWLKNIDMFSEKGIKKPALDAATEIHRNFKRMRKVPLLVTGHSKAGATAIAYMRMFGADHCIAFCPARSLRYWAGRKMENTTIFIDPNDPVPKAGLLSFGHPICDRVILPRDHIGIRVSDHFMSHINKFVLGM